MKVIKVSPCRKYITFYNFTKTSLLPDLSQLCPKLSSELETNETVNPLYVKDKRRQRDKRFNECTLLRERILCIYVFVYVCMYIYTCVCISGILYS